MQGFSKFLGRERFMQKIPQKRNIILLHFQKEAFFRLIREALQPVRSTLPIQAALPVPQTVLVHIHHHRKKG